jgi:hypothetical protein
MDSKRRNPQIEARWRDAIERHRASGLTTQAFCRREQLAAPSFYAWRYAIQERDAELDIPARPPFVPLIVRDLENSTLFSDCRGQLGVVIKIEHDLAETEKACPCCGEVSQRMGYDMSEQLEHLPASFQVLRHLRHKYVCHRCEAETLDAQIAMATRLPQPTDKGLAGLGLLAYVITSRLGDLSAIAAPRN